jgi:hypothetical protein
MTEKIIVKKVVVGTPVKRVTAGSFAITNLGGVDVTATQNPMVLFLHTNHRQVITRLLISGVIIMSL